jgi:hypothetical protein
VLQRSTNSTIRGFSYKNYWKLKFHNAKSLKFVKWIEIRSLDLLRLLW